MPVVAQGCKPKPAPTTTTTDKTETSKSRNAGFEDDEMDPSTLNGAIAAAQQARALQTGNAAMFLAAIDKDGRHPHAGKNVKINSSSSSKVPITGYVTEKGLFKQWSDANLMTKSGKYGCPAATTITDFTGTGKNYSVPDSNNVKGSYSQERVNYGSYVGAPITNSTPTMFMGSKFAQDKWDGYDASLPACGNEGSNVQVIYPAKSTGTSYKGTYNANKSATEKYMTKHDMGSAVTHDSCKQRAEDVGHSVFGLSFDTCYTAPTLNESTQGGIAYEIKRSNLSGPEKAVQFYFSMNGKIQLLKTAYKNYHSSNEEIALSNDNPNRIYDFGRIGHSQQSNQVVQKCMYGHGGLLATPPEGTWGENCNNVRIPYLKNVYIGTW